MLEENGDLLNLFPSLLPLLFVFLPAFQTFVALGAVPILFIELDRAFCAGPNGIQYKCTEVSS